MPHWLLSLLLAPAVLSAQAPALRPYRASPAATLSQDLGICSATVTYHRPEVKGRTIWGDLVPFDAVWRTGANEATTLTLSHPALFGGKPVSAGRYALFILPGKTRWTWILSRQTSLWGSYGHKPSEDVARVEVPVQTIPHQERLRFDLDPAKDDTLRLTLAWERRAASVDLTFDARGIYWNHLQVALAHADPKAWAPLYQAAQYCWTQGIRLDLAHEWVDRSLAIQETFWNLELKARLLQRLGKTPEALQRLERAIELARPKAPAEYLTNLEKLRQEWQTTRDPDTLCPPCCQ